MKLLFIPLLMLAATLTANAHCGGCGTGSKDKAHSHETTVSEAPAKKCCGTGDSCCASKKADCSGGACEAKEKSCDSEKGCEAKEKKSCCGSCGGKAKADKAAAAPKISCCPAPKAGA